MGISPALCSPVLQLLNYTHTRLCRTESDSSSCHNPDPTVKLFQLFCNKHSATHPQPCPFLFEPIAIIITIIRFGSLFVSLSKIDSVCRRVHGICSVANFFFRISPAPSFVLSEDVLEVFYRSSLICFRFNGLCSAPMAVYHISPMSSNVIG